MNARILLLVCLSMLVLAAPATGATKVVGDSDRLAQIERWIDHSRVPTPDGTITVEDRDCYEFGGSSCAWRETATIYLDPEDNRAVFMHELGHFFDYWVMTDAARRQVLRLAGDTREWISPPNSPHERFAEKYAYLATHGRRHMGKPRLGYRARFRDPSRLRHLIRRVARKNAPR